MPARLIAALCLFAIIVPCIAIAQELEYTIDSLLTLSEGGHEELEFDLESVEETYGPAVIKITFTSIDNLDEIKSDPRQQEDLDSYSGGQGSGFFINGDGYIITNAHVVNDANRRTIKCRSHLTGNTEFELKLIGIGNSETIDLALLRLDPKEHRRFLKLAEIEELPFLKIGYSELASKTEEIAVLGYPEDSDDLRVKEANLSGWEFLDDDDDLFQFMEVATASAVQSGNSGGAAVNRYGELIGIPARARWSGSTGYLIPTHILIHFIEQIANNQEGDIPLHLFNLGTTYERTYPGMAVLAGLNEDFVDFEIGRAIFRVRPLSPAEQIGLKPGDLILSFRNLQQDVYVYLDYEGHVKTTGKMRIIEKGGKTWDNSEARETSLDELILMSNPGDTIELEYARAGADGIQKAVWQTGYWNRKPVDYLGVFEVPDFEEWGGMILQDINSENVSVGKLVENRELFNEGVIAITNVDGGSLADDRQIETYITALNGIRVRNLEEFRKVINDINTAYDEWITSEEYDEETARYQARFYVNVEYLASEYGTMGDVRRWMTFPVEKARQKGTSLDADEGFEEMFEEMGE